MSDIEFRVKALWVKSRIEKVLVYENKERVWIHNIAVNNLDLRKLPSVKIKTDVSSENTVGWLDSFVNLTVLTRWTHHARVISSNFEAQTLSAIESLKNSIGPKILIKVWLLENNQIQNYQTLEVREFVFLSYLQSNVMNDLIKGRYTQILILAKQMF